MIKYGSWTDSEQLLLMTISNTIINMSLFKNLHSSFLFDHILMMQMLIGFCQNASQFIKVGTKNESNVHLDEVAWFTR